jgi:hypothetical protein
MDKIEVDAFFDHFFVDNADYIVKLVVDSIKPGTRLIPMGRWAPAIVDRIPADDHFSHSVLLRAVTTSGRYCVNVAQEKQLVEIISVVDRGMGAKEFIETAGFQFRYLLRMNL